MRPVELWDVCAFGRTKYASWKSCASIEADPIPVEAEFLSALITAQTVVSRNLEDTAANLRWEKRDIVSGPR